MQTALSAGDGMAGSGGELNAGGGAWSTGSTGKHRDLAEIWERGSAQAC